MKEFINTSKDKGKFKAFIPFGDPSKMIVEKEVGGVKRKFLHGIASNTQVDKEGERVTKNFIAKMKEQAIGLTVFAEHEHTIDKTLGFIDEIGGDEENFEVVTSLEPEYNPENNPTGNETVTKVLTKLKHGTKLGYSIGGRVTKAVKVYDEELKKDIIELDDGELFEVTVTAMPAGKNTFVQPLIKSMNEFVSEMDQEEDQEEKQTTEKKSEIKHSNKISDEEPLWSGISKSKLPAEAFAGEDQFPHHWVENGQLGDNDTYVNGEMFLHKSGLIIAWGMINKSENVDEKVRKHLVDHIKSLGITINQSEKIYKTFENQKTSESEIGTLIKSYSQINKFVDDGDLTQLSKALDEIVEMDNIHNQVYDLFWAFKSAIYQIVNNVDLEPVQKKDKIKTLADEFGDKIENLSATLAELAQAIDEQIG